MVFDYNFTPTPPNISPETVSGTGPDKDSYTGKDGRLNDPVHGATGAFSTAATDAYLPGIGMPFQFTRSYTSSDPTVGPLGLGWTHSYATALTIMPNGDVVLRNEDGQEVYYTLQPGAQFTGGSGVRSAFQFAPEGGYDLVRHNQDAHHFDASGRLQDITDRNDNTVSLMYINNRLKTITDTVGRQITVNYNAAGLIRELSLPDGRNVLYTYVGSKLVTVRDLVGGVTRYTYDAGGRLAKIVDPNRHTVVRNVYDPATGRTIEQYDARNVRTALFEYTVGGDVAITKFKDGRGNVWTNEYTGNVLTRSIDPLGKSTSYGYDAGLNLMLLTDKGGGITGMTYDANGNMLARSNPLDHVEFFTYDDKNNLLTIKDARGNATTRSYDFAGNLMSITTADSSVTTFGRDPSGNGLLRSITDARLKTTQFAYDVSGNLQRVTSPENVVTTYGYDASGRLTSRADLLGHTTTYAYDAADRDTSVTDPNGAVTRLRYDPVGNLLRVTDANGHATIYAYDAADRDTSVTGPDGAITTYAYDKVGNLVKRTAPTEAITVYAYDDANRLSSVTSPTGQIWTYAYDAKGNRTQVVDAIGNSTPDPADGTTIYAYDVLNQPVEINYSDATPDVTFKYDGNGNRTGMVDGAGTVHYTYDNRNRLTKVTRGTDSFAYRYDAAGNLTRRTYPGGVAVSYMYDNDGRLKSLSTGGATTRYEYDAASRLTTRTLPAANGYVETYEYDGANRTTRVRSTRAGVVLTDVMYTLDAVGNPMTQVTPTTATSYTYDDADRLLRTCFNTSCTNFLEYTYDGVGNRLTAHRPTGTTTFTYNAADERLSETGPSGTLAYSFDADGRQTLAGTKLFSYDLAHRLASTTDAGVTTTYSYDGDGVRLRAATGPAANQQVSYIWDTNAGLPLLALERDGAGAGLRRYTYGNDLESLSSGANVFQFHHDRLGSVLALTSSSGEAQWTYTYGPFGSSQAVQVSPTAPFNPMRFTGQYLDGTGLYHLRARQYDGYRFLTMDPLPAGKAVPSTSAYAYANNRPTVLMDPTGRKPQCKVIRPGSVDYESLIASNFSGLRARDAIRNASNINYLQQQNVKNEVLSDAYAVAGTFSSYVRNVAIGFEIGSLAALAAGPLAAADAAATFRLGGSALGTGITFGLGDGWLARPLVPYVSFWDPVTDASLCR